MSEIGRVLSFQYIQDVDPAQRISAISPYPRGIYSYSLETHRDSIAWIAYFASNVNCGS